MIEIRPATRHDVRDIAVVLHRSWMKTYINHELGITEEVLWEFFKIRNSPEKIEERINSFGRNPNDRTFVAERRTSVIGLIRIVVHPKSDEIKALYVDPLRWRRGIGTMLMKEARRHFHPQKRERVWVADYNERAIEFYRSQGFWMSGRKNVAKGLVLPNGSMIPELEMSIEKRRRE